MPKDAERSPIILPPESEIKGESEQNPALRSAHRRRRRTSFLVSLMLVTLAILMAVDGTFGTTAAAVIKYAGPYIEAMQSHGLIACLKHYPGGLGNTPYDAHDILPTDNRSREQIYATELAPYKTFINSPNPLMRPGMIMSTDVLMPAIDPNMPAELSHKFMTDILRNEFGYDGVVLTDALYMGGISARWSEPEAAVLAIQAGNDMILSPMGSARTAAVIEALKQALNDGRLSMARVNEAVTRIIALKMQYHLMP